MSYETYKRALEQEYKKTQQYQNDFYTYYKVREDRGDKEIKDYERSHIFGYDFAKWCKTERKLHPDDFRKVFDECTLSNLELVYKHVEPLVAVFKLADMYVPSWEK